ncbi:MAG: CDP-glucose 4,6-dehydratase [Bdellovibrionales bacterium]|nr:CDP-glucose 4,6-dehydratase [Bdellovibrionales bacterium]
MKSVFQGKRVLVTGHTGFKGVWLCQMLEQLGANVTGVALEPEGEPNHFSQIAWSHLKDIRLDIRDGKELKKIALDAKPEIVFHLAAQSLVRPSYEDPVLTYETNVLGTLHLLEAVRAQKSISACLVITSDKCYENQEIKRGYKETDSMGGYDPYSSSKGCTELLVSSYRRSYFSDASTLLASVRAGNVIGGGDWSKDRLLPDLLVNAFQGKTVMIRNPESVRPWQHVLEALYGYLMLARGLSLGKKEWATGWNFGPEQEDCVSVRTICESVLKLCSELKFEMAAKKDGPHEAGLLYLDTTKAKTELEWKPHWPLSIGLEKTIQWYKAFYEQGSILTQNQIEDYLKGVMR